MTEIWKDVIGYEGLYQVSNLGRVKSVKRVVKRDYNNNLTVIERIRGNGMCGRYLNVSLFNKNAKTFLVHRVVAQAFIPNPENLPFVNHKDGNVLNNNADNLEWCTRSYNSLHAVNVLGKQLGAKGERNGRTSLTEEKVKEIRSLLKTHQGRVVAKMFNVSDSTISKILRNQNWKEAI